MSDESQHLAVPTTLVTASTQLSTLLGIEKGMMIDTIKRQCFKNSTPDQITDAQLAAFISVANQFKVNPMLPGFLYAYPERNGGIQVMIGPDLMFKLLSENPNVESWETTVFPEDVTLPPTHAVTKIYRIGREKPVTYTALLSEWRVQSNPNWVTRPRHMLSIRALKQAARQIIHGLPFDEDERKIAEMVNVTPSDTEQPKRVEAPAKATTGAAAATAEKKTRAPKAQTEPAKVVEGDFHMAKPEDPKPTEPVTTLGADEKRTFICKVEQFTTQYIDSGGKTHASVKVTLDGEFKGSAIHLGGANVIHPDGDNGVAKLQANDAYQLDKPVSITLVGKGQKPRIVDGKEVPRPAAILVESISIAQVAPTSAAPVTEPAKAENEQVD